MDDTDEEGIHTKREASANGQFRGIPSTPRLEWAVNPLLGREGTSTKVLGQSLGFTYSDIAAKSEGKNARGGPRLAPTRVNLRARLPFSQGRVNILYYFQTSQINSRNYQKTGFSRVFRGECRCREV